MFDAVGYLARRWGLVLADRAVTNAMVRWTWSSMTETGFTGRLADFRPVDADAVREMMAGRYVLAARLVDTEGISPFAVPVPDAEWSASLHSFAWLRHFQKAGDAGEKRFALMLVLDWIGHHGRYRRDSWALGVTARRVLNWLRHYNVLVDAASPEQARTIARALRTQVQALRNRVRVAPDPREQLLAEVALVGVALCDDSPPERVATAFSHLLRTLSDQLDHTGLHLSRNSQVQVQLLVELAALRLSLMRDHQDLAAQLGPPLEPMHRALDALTLGTGEPAYFNGCGQMPHDILIALQAQNPARQHGSGLVGGYGILRAGPSTLIADSGLVPPPRFAADAHAGALAIEFSHGTELVLGSCGPAPAELAPREGLFREGIAHSGPTINAVSAAAIAWRGAMAGRLRPRGPAPELELDAADGLLVLRTDAYAGRFGVQLERRVSLLADGKTLVGQDRMLAAGTRTPTGTLLVRFHLAPGARVARGDADKLVRLTLSGGAVWTFLWEGAELNEEDSARQSAYFGFHKTRQLVLETPVAANGEIAWVMTREDA